MSAYKFWASRGRCFSALVVQRDGTLFRTSFHYETHHGMAIYKAAARARGWTPVAVVRVSYHDLPAEKEQRLVEIK